MTYSEPASIPAWTGADNGQHHPQRREQSTLARPGTPSSRASLVQTVRSTSAAPREATRPLHLPLSMAWAQSRLVSENSYSLTTQEQEARHALPTAGLLPECSPLTVLHYQPAVHSFSFSPRRRGYSACMKGRYEGQVVAVWLGDGRNMQLREAFAYIDASGMRWDVPSEARIDGASIPRVLWTLCGGSV